MILLALIITFFNFSLALPTQEIKTHNVNKVLSTCPEGQELIKGQCRDVWNWRNNMNTGNQGVISVIDVPPNCPPGQELIKGVCRVVWRLYAPTSLSQHPDPSLSNRNVITVPPNCPPGQQWINGACRDVWIRAATPSLPKNYDYTSLEQKKKRQVDTEVNIEDYFDSLKISSQVDRNIINIPNQCPVGYRPDAFGICRQILI